MQKLYYIGPMFRRERPQKGRYRQFFQIGAEAIGSESPLVDAEVIEMVVEILTRAGLTGFQAADQLGGRSELPSAVRRAAARGAEGKSRRSMCGDCQRRAETNPLRVLDCKVPKDQPIIDALPSILDYLCEPCRAHFAAVQQYLDDRGIAYEVRPRLVRGLDYYMRTTFEVVHGALGAQNSVLGGGRYDGLAESLGSKVHCAGHRILDRRRPAGDERGRRPGSHAARSVHRAAGRGGAAARRASWRAISGAPGYSVELAEGKLKRAMELANKLAARYALIVGDNEIAAGRYTLKNMASGEQQKLTQDEIAAKLAAA